MFSIYIYIHAGNCSITWQYPKRQNSAATPDCTFPQTSAHSPVLSAVLLSVLSPYFPLIPLYFPRYFPLIPLYFPGYFPLIPLYFPRYFPLIPLFFPLHFPVLSAVLSCYVDDKRRVVLWDGWLSCIKPINNSINKKKPTSTTTQQQADCIRTE